MSLRASAEFDDDEDDEPPVLKTASTAQSSTGVSELKASLSNLREEYNSKAREVLDSNLAMKRSHDQLTVRVSDLETQLAAAKAAAEQSSAKAVALMHEKADLTSKIEQLSAAISEKVELVAKNTLNTQTSSQLGDAQAQLRQAAEAIKV